MPRKNSAPVLATLVLVLSSIVLTGSATTALANYTQDNSTRVTPMTGGLTIEIGVSRMASRSSDGQSSRTVTR